jgi:hypothetical protein
LSQEEEYFKKIEAEQMAKLRAIQDAASDAEALIALKSLHYHRCGKCGQHMNSEIYRGIEIEVCTDCQAVLLDPGELNTLAGDDNSAWITSFFQVFGGGYTTPDEGKD